MFTFDRGIIRKRDPLMLQDGELYTAKGFSFETDGKLECRTPVEKQYDVAVANLHEFHRYGTSLMVAGKKLCPGGLAYFNYMYHRTTTGTS